MRQTRRGVRATQVLLPGVALLALTGAVVAGTDSVTPTVLAASSPGALSLLPVDVPVRAGDASCGRWGVPGLWDMIFPTCNENIGGGNR